jgi:hypothetical protein
LALFSPLVLTIGATKNKNKTNIITGDLRFFMSFLEIRVSINLLPEIFDNYQE